MPDSGAPVKRIEEILGVIRRFEKLKSVSELTTLLANAAL